MARWHPKKCRDCGQRRTLEEPISAQGYCSKCGNARMIQNALEINAQLGPYFEHWARRSLMAMHRKLLAAERESA